MNSTDFLRLNLDAIMTRVCEPGVPHAVMIDVERLVKAMRREHVCTGDLAPVFLMINEQFRNEYFAGEELAPVLVRLLGDLLSKRSILGSDAAVLAERERCAKVADNYYDGDAMAEGAQHRAPAARDIAAAIRRGPVLLCRCPRPPMTPHEVGAPRCDRSAVVRSGEG